MSKHYEEDLSRCWFTEFIEEYPISEDEMSDSEELKILINQIVEWWTSDKEDSEFFNEINKLCPSVVRAFNEFYAKNRE
jgi:hypothetical protein